MQPGNALVLVIEDERAIRRFLRASLADAGYRLNEAASGDEGLKLASSQPPDLVLLDLGLPDLDGQEILSRLREWYTGPLVVLSARDQEQQKIKALDQGADDYVTKPFSIGELLARIRTALRHSVANSSEDTVLVTGDLHVDLAARVVRRGEKEIHLTPLEYKLLTTLMKQPGKVLTHRYLLREVWGPDDSQENHYLRVFVASLRRKLTAPPPHDSF